MIPDYLKTMVLTYKNAVPKSNQNSIAEGNSDSNPSSLNNQPGVSDPNLKLQLTSFGKRNEVWVDADQDGLATIFELDVTEGLTSDRDELTLRLKANDQIHYIFITDALGKIWCENEIDAFQQILKIDTYHFPNGIYNILIENDGSFSAKRLIKAK